MFIISVVLNNFIMENFKTNLGFEFSLEVQSIDRNSKTQDVFVSSDGMECTVKAPASHDLIDIAGSKKVQDIVNAYVVGLLSLNISEKMLSKGKDFKIQVSGNIILHVDYNQYIGPEAIINFINNQ